MPNYNNIQPRGLEAMRIPYVDSIILSHLGIDTIRDLMENIDKALSANISAKSKKKINHLYLEIKKHRKS